MRLAADRKGEGGHIQVNGRKRRFLTPSRAPAQASKELPPWTTSAMLPMTDAFAPSTIRDSAGLCHHRSVAMVAARQRLRAELPLCRGSPSRQLRSARSEPFRCVSQLSVSLATIRRTKPSQHRSLWICSTSWGRNPSSHARATSHAPGRTRNRCRPHRRVGMSPCKTDNGPESETVTARRSFSAA